MFLWIGQECSPSTLLSLFKVDHISQIDSSSHQVPQLDNPQSTQLATVVLQLRQKRPRFMQLSIIRQGLDPQNEMRFLNILLEDANLDNMSYVEYLVNVHRHVQGNLTKK